MIATDIIDLHELLQPAGACSGPLAPAGACWCLLVFAGACWCLLESTRVCWGLLGPAGVCWGLLGLAGVLQGLPRLDGACRGLLGPAGASWVWLTHLDAQRPFSKWVKESSLRCSSLYPCIRLYFSLLELSFSTDHALQQTRDYGLLGVLFQTPAYWEQVFLVIYLIRWKGLPCHSILLVASKIRVLVASIQKK